MSSIYDFMGSDYEAPTQSPKPLPEVETVHQNRANLSEPYVGQFNDRAKDAPTDSAPTTSAAYEWGKFIANRDTVSPIARLVHLKFTRNSINGDNFKSEKERYFKLYGEMSK